MFKTPMMLAAGLGLALGLVACGQAGPTTPAPDAANRPDAAGQSGQATRLNGAMDLFANLPLSEAQTVQLNAIAEKYRALWPQSTTGRVRALVLAEAVDAEALRQALAAEPTDEARLATLSAMLVEARAVLTPDQRQTLVQQLQALALPAPAAKSVTLPTDAERAALVERAATQLGLNADQKAALGAYVAQQQAAAATAPAPAAPAARRDAMVSFMQSGDAQALAPLKPVTARLVAVDALIALVTQLSQAQRQALFGSS